MLTSIGLLGFTKQGVKGSPHRADPSAATAQRLGPSGRDTLMNIHNCEPICTLDDPQSPCLRTSRAHKHFNALKRHP